MQHSPLSADTRLAEEVEAGGGFSALCSLFLRDEDPLMGSCASGDSSISSPLGLDALPKALTWELGLN